ncbi:hypothetical protein MmiHf6_01290 [Methanimicrococcus hongohii]|uniref:Uncharacterized protein n=1 Tax=Methanimicrococcus hongohii TaxID=3028295 RepID=A0AA96UYB2_9EURY|nr:hypothetical protein MmiHf6_01290 [Methanimicrococcus sp. Hf6]
MSVRVQRFSKLDVWVTTGFYKCCSGCSLLFIGILFIHQDPLHEPIY